MTRELAVLAIVAAIGCGASSPQPDRPSAPQPTVEVAATPAAGPDDHCTTADDCVLVEACCGCTIGGHRIAIRKDAVAAYDATRPQRCGGRMCMHLMSHDPTCDAEPICGSGNRCRVAPHMQHQ